MLVVFEILAHNHKKRGNVELEKRCDILAIVTLAVAILAEIIAFPYSRRVDTLANQEIAAQMAKVDALEKQSRAKPFKDRLKEFLDKKNTVILERLKADEGTFSWSQYDLFNEYDRCGRHATPSTRFDSFS